MRSKELATRFNATRLPLSGLVSALVFYWVVSWADAVKRPYAINDGAAAAAVSFFPNLTAAPSC